MLSYARPAAWWLVAAALLVAMCNARLSRAHSTAEQQAARKERKAAELRVGFHCAELPTTKRISFVSELIKNLNLLDIGGILSKPSPSRLSLKGMYQSSIQPCLQQAAAILDLEPIIEQQRNVCTKRHLDLMERYYETHLKMAPVATASPFNVMISARPITEHFFMLYAMQVAHACKKNMLHALNHIENMNVVTEADFDMALPWLRESAFMQTCKRDPFDKEPKRPNSGQRPVKNQKNNKDRCEARSIITSISNIDELAILLDSEETIVAMNKLSSDKGSRMWLPSSSSPPDDDQSSPIIVVPPNRMEMVASLAMACHKFKPIYDNIVLTVVRLTKMGASTEFEKFDQACAQSARMKKWFGLTLACETMLKSRLVDDYEKYRAYSDKGDDVFVVLDECPDSKTDCSPMGVRFKANKEHSIAELDQMTNTLDDELWIHKYGRTKLQQFKRNIFRAMHRWWKVTNAEDHIVYVRTSDHVKRWFTRGFMSVLLALAINLL